MKWIGQYIVDFIARFRSDVYLEEIANPGSDTDKFLVADATTGKVGFRTGADVLSDIGASSESTDLEFNGSTANGVLTYGGAAQIDVESGFTFNPSFGLATISSSVNALLTLHNTHASNVPAIAFQRTVAGSDGDGLGEIKWMGDDDGGMFLSTGFAKILGEIETAADTDEAGKLSLTVACSNDTTSALQQALIATGHGTNNIVDIGLGYGTASTTTIAGTLTMGGTAALTNVGLVAVANQSNITGVGTISSGVWEGTTIKTAYIGDDQVTEDKLANTLLAEIDANTAKVTNSDQSQADINALDITEVGALASGTIADGFGNIDNGTSTLDTGVATAASLVCTAGATFGGGYGSTGATITTAGVGTFNGALTADASITAGGTLAVYAQGTTTGGRILMREGSDNGTNYIGFTAPAALTGNTAFTLPDGDGSANQVLKTDGGAVLAWTDMGGGASGWHGSATRIKILHSDFIPDDGGRPAMIDDTGVGSEELFLKSHSSNPLYATVAIPTGFKATHVMVYGTGGSQAMEVWEHQINSKTGVSKGTGNVGTEIDITDVTSSTTNYLFISAVNSSGREVHGGYVTIAAV